MDLVPEPALNPNLCPNNIIQTIIVISSLFCIIPIIIVITIIIIAVTKALTSLCLWEPKPRLADLHDHGGSL